MMMHGKIALAAGLSLLLAAAASRAQETPKAVAKPNQPGLVDKAEIEKARADVMRLQQEAQKKFEELQKAMQRLEQLEGRGQPGPGGFVPGGGFRPPMGGGGPGFPGGPMPPGGGFPGGGGPMPPGGFVPGGGPPGMPPMGQPGVEQRLKQLEQKLDLVLQELRAMRGDMKPGQKAPKAGGGALPLPPQPPQPPRNFDAVPPPLPPAIERR
jgi:hypothetical protein